MHGLTKDRRGQAFGKLTVIEYAGSERQRGAYRTKVLWKCKCSCGNTIVVTANNLISGNTKSCGCIADQSRKTKWNLRHGHVTDGVETKVYIAWINMRRRCYDPKNASYERYGGRGITVCERWMTFENFYADIGDPPTPDHSIDRIDNNGNYEPGNCKWSTATEQQLNRRYHYENSD